MASSPLATNSWQRAQMMVGALTFFDEYRLPSIPVVFSGLDCGFSSEFEVSGEDMSSPARRSLRTVFWSTPRSFAIRRVLSPRARRSVA
jgi:hypothetical protein